MRNNICAYEKNIENGLVVRGFNYSDWLALDCEQFKYDVCGRTDITFIASAFYAECLRIMSEIASLLGDRLIVEYKNKRTKTLAAIQSEYVTPNGRLACDTMTAQTLALVFDLVPNSRRAAMARALNENTIAHDYRITTGFVGTPYLLFALADNGYFDTACRVLMNNDYPGWLYEVDMGATTIWERWNGLMPDGTPNPDGMNSYNHYAYGSVMEFVYRRIAGIEPIEAGFRKIKVAPRPCVGLDALTAEYCSVSGKIVSGYERKNGKVIYRIEIPDEVRAEIVLPDKQTKDVGGGIYEFVI